MATTVSMPQLGETVTEGTVLRWAKKVGDSIAEDEVLVEISTDKVDTEVPSPIAGTILEILVAEGDTVEVGIDLVVIGEADEERSSAAPAETVESAAEPAPEPAPIPPSRLPRRVALRRHRRQMPRSRPSSPSLPRRGHPHNSCHR